MSYPTRTDPKLMLVTITVIATLVMATYAFVTWPKPTFTVYTYDSFMYWGDDTDTIDERMFGEFERRYGVNVSIERLPTDANGIISKLIGKLSKPIASIKTSLDNVNDSLNDVFLKTPLNMVIYSVFCF